MRSPKSWSRLVLALVIVVAILASSVVTLLVVMFASRDTVPRGYVPEGYISIEDAQALISSATLSAGSMRMEFQELSETEARQITNGTEELLDAYERNPMEAATVNPRDWDRYASRIATEGMTAAERTLYDRYDDCCRSYLEMGVDGFQSGTPDDRFYYGSGVEYLDLGLSRDQAQDLFFWFKFNNPQYYFLRNGAATSRTAMYPMMYERFADGNERARTTNKLFDKLDSWIESICDDEITTWQMELAANDLLCRKLVYDEDEPFFQSMYSAVLLERTVCAGYSETFCAMMNAVGVDAMVALNDIHAWNVVKFDDGNYYVVDVLWNENDTDNDSPLRTYFNVGEVSAKAWDTDEAQHTFGASLIAWAPDLSQSDYVPTEYDLTGSRGVTERLGTPQNLRSGDDDGEAITVDWDPVDGAAQYTVELYDGDQTTLLLSKVFPEPGVSVLYGSSPALALRVRAEDGERMSEWSELLAFTTRAEAAEPSPSPSPAVVLDAPQNIVITKDEADTTHFSWDEVEGADQYQVILFKDPEYTETWLSSFRTEPTKGYTKLQPGTTYYHGIRAMKTVDGEDHYSEWTYFSHTTPEAPATPAPSAGPVTVGVPANITFDKDEPEAIRFSWDTVEGADQYQVVQFKDAGYQEILRDSFTTDTFRDFINLTPGETCYFGVRAVKTVDGEDRYSDWTRFSHTTPQ